MIKSKIRKGLKFGRFNKTFLMSIENHELIEPINLKRMIVHTVRDKGEKVAIVGLYPTRKKFEYFYVIAIHSKYRGRGYPKKISDSIAKKYKVRKLYATISRRNRTSIEAHRKVGFIKVPKELDHLLREKGYLDKGDIRMVKEYGDKKN